MFFIIGISSAEKRLDFNQTMQCFRCGQFGRYEVFITYTYFTFFFIPLIKWNKKFYVKATCCNTMYTIDSTLGKRIQDGEHIILTEQDLTPMYQSSNKTAGQCPSCGYITNPEHAFCPKCGTRL
ncbi:MAG: hypothetical protein K0S41_1271 [Anaerocolumna sp.]|jgi:ribosomal protein L37E|nr:hypothetical protein [Anaerocolumna sp.]